MKKVWERRSHAFPPHYTPDFIAHRSPRVSPQTALGLQAERPDRNIRDSTPPSNIQNFEVPKFRQLRIWGSG